MRVIFVCHGNVNRSRAAEWIARKLDSTHEFRSAAAGEKVEGGKLITKKMRTLLEEHGIPFDATSRSVKLTQADIDWADLVVLFDARNLEHIGRQRFAVGSKARSLGKYIGKKSIKDPGMTKGTDVYRTVLAEIMQAVPLLLAELK